jgi:putative endonuclease
MGIFRGNRAKEVEHLVVGRVGEDAACRYLWKKGYRILERNFRKGDGEIDIIAEKNRVIFIVEVKTRRSGDPEKALEAVDESKRKLLRKTARAYLSQFDREGLEIKFKVVGVILDSHMKLVAVEGFSE